MLERLRFWMKVVDSSNNDIKAEIYSAINRMRLTPKMERPPYLLPSSADLPADPTIIDFDVISVASTLSHYCMQEVFKELPINALLLEQPANPDIPEHVSGCFKRH